MAALKKRKTNLISVVIPAYKAQNIIEETILRVKDILEQIRYPYELICVVDGTSDDNSYEIAKKIARKYPNIKVYGYKINYGKGNAVRYGFSKAKGEILGFIDSGLDINPNGLSMLLEHFEWYNADIIVGSKRHPVSKVVYPRERRIISFGYQVIVRVLFGLNIKDTQVGMKFFRKEVIKKILPRLLVKEFAFDIEMLSVANYLGFKKIYEAPVELINMKFTGKVSTIISKGFIRTIWRTLWDTMAVFYRLKILKYYDDKNKSKWITPDYLTKEN